MPTGTLVLPIAGDVRLGTLYGAAGTEFTGTFAGGGVTDYPAAGNVRAGVGYNFGALTGTLTLPPTGNVQLGIPYGAGGAEFTGTLYVPTLPTAPTAGDTNDLVEAAVAAKLDAALPDNWHVYVRRDNKLLPGDQFPLAYVVALESQVLEEETDNRDLVGYPQAVFLAVREAAKKRTDADLVTLRRTAQQAVYTTDYTSLAAAGLPVEDVRIGEDPSIELPELEAGITATGFLVTIGLVESRQVPAPAG